MAVVALGGGGRAHLHGDALDLLASARAHALFLALQVVQRLRDDLLRRFPDLEAEIDPPADQTGGMWHLDIARNGKIFLVVEWRPDRGFGISTVGEDDPGYGEGPDEVYPNVKATYDRVVRLILSSGRTVPPEAVRLAELRQIRGLSQAELAERAGLKQANLSRFENRGDARISTLEKIVTALGASLSISARFPDGSSWELRL